MKMVYSPLNEDMCTTGLCPDWFFGKEIVDNIEKCEDFGTVLLIVSLLTVSDEDSKNFFSFKDEKEVLPAAIRAGSNILQWPLKKTAALNDLLVLNGE